MRALLAVSLLLAACDTEPPRLSPTPPPTPTAPTTTAPDLVPAPIPVPVPETAPAVLPVRLADRILAGDVLPVSGVDGELQVLLLGIPDEPRPDGPVIGRTPIHHAVMTYRSIGDEPSPPATALMVGPGPRGLGERCERRVTRARRLHVTFVSSDTGRADGTATFLGLELAPGECEGVSGVIGTPDVSVFPVNEATLRPAPEALTREITPLDVDWRGPPNELRILSMPDADLRVLEGNSPWVLTQGTRARLRDTAGEVGIDFVLVAGWRTFLYLENHITSETLLRPMEPFVPELRHVSCVVIDTSPLNVRRRPRADGEIIATLPNGTVLEAMRGPSSWARVATEPAGWAHLSGLRCTDLPNERWR